MTSSLNPKAQHMQTLAARALLSGLPPLGRELAEAVLAQDAEAASADANLEAQRAPGEKPTDAMIIYEFLRKPDWDGEDFDLIAWLNNRPCQAAYRLAHLSIDVTPPLDVSSTDPYQDAAVAEAEPVEWQALRYDGKWVRAENEAEAQHWLSLYGYVTVRALYATPEAALRASAPMSDEWRAGFEDARHLAEAVCVRREFGLREVHSPAQAADALADTIGRLSETDARSPTDATPAPGREGGESDDAAFVPLGDCEPGPFETRDGTLGFKSEYRTAAGAVEAYCFGSGEFFWGGTSSPAAQIMVRVRHVGAARRAPTAPDGGAVTERAYFERLDRVVQALGADRIADLAAGRLAPEAILSNYRIALEAARASAPANGAGR